MAGFIGSVTAFPAKVLAVAADVATVEVAAFQGSVQARAVPGLVVGQEVTLAIRPEKLVISQARPEGANVIAGQVKDLAYFGKDSLYRITLPSGELISVHSVNAGRAADGRPDWDDQIYLSFAPGSAILLVG